VSGIPYIETVSRVINERNVIPDNPAISLIVSGDLMTSPEGVQYKKKYRPGSDGDVLCAGLPDTPARLVVPALCGTPYLPGTLRNICLLIL
jgi:hypothetical protein